MVTLRWGVENEHIYCDRKVRKEDLWPGVSLQVGARYMAYREPPPQEWFECVDTRHRAIWKSFQEINPKAARLLKKGPGTFSKEELDALREAFFDYKRQQDPYCAKVFQEKCPVLYFDFLTDSSKTYVLEKIKIETIDFSEYKGGGFVAREAWQDIVLSHRPGIRSYFPDKRLTFETTGRVELRFWSDNYYPNVGWLVPMGAYVLRITFHFIVEGAAVKVATAPFMIDV